MKRILRMLTHIVIGLAVIAACVGLYRFGIMALLVTLLPLNDVQIVVLRRVGVAASLIVGYLAVARYYERRTVTEFAFKPVAISIGALSGCLLIGITIVSLFALGNYRVLAFRGLSATLPIIGFIVPAVMIEEVVFRGVVFRLLEQYAGSVRALIAQALIFGGLHLFNEGTSVMTMISVTLLGAFWAAIYMQSRNLWVVIANHCAWNVTIFVSGVPLSGQEGWRSAAPLESSYHGSVWLTGGEFGPEDSILNILIMAGALGGLIYWNWHHRAFLRPI